MKITKLTTKNVKSIIDIEKKVYKSKAWKLNKFIDYLNEANIYGKYIADEEKIVGYCIYEEGNDEINILNLTCLENDENTFKKLLNSFPEKKTLKITVKDDRLKLQEFLKTYGMKGKLCSDFFASGKDGITFIRKGGD